MWCFYGKKINFLLDKKACTPWPRVLDTPLFCRYNVGPQDVLSITHLEFCWWYYFDWWEKLRDYPGFEESFAFVWEISRLKVKFLKSMLFSNNVTGSWLHEAAIVMNFKHDCITFVYLRLPIGGDPQKLQLWHPLVDPITE